MSERLNYKVNNAEERETPCPYIDGEYVGSGFCTNCPYEEETEYDDERMIGYVICTLQEKKGI
jgi:hypothetical protein